jgi:hypothetical protein
MRDGGEKSQNGHVCDVGVDITRARRRRKMGLVLTSTANEDKTETKQCYCSAIMGFMQDLI